MDYPYSGIACSGIWIVKKNEVDLLVLNFPQDLLLSEKSNIQSSVHAVYI